MKVGDIVMHKHDEQYTHGIVVGYTVCHPEYGTWAKVLWNLGDVRAFSFNLLEVISEDW